MSWGGGGGSGSGLQVPSLCARMMTEGLQHGSGGGVVSSNRASSHRDRLLNSSSPSESEGCGVTSPVGGDGDSRARFTAAFFKGNSTCETKTDARLVNGRKCKHARTA